ncbi:MAG: MauE/DoxX family redox-associated membrane protein [Bryobacteraceae bacterium]
MTQAASDAGPLEPARWKTSLSVVSAVLLALTFIVAGVWKVTDPLAAAVRMTQAQVPQALSLPAALAFGIAETFAGVLLLVPRFRRWGAWLSGLLLVAFIVYIGLYYNVLRGEECNCFPWLRRAVGPAFFIGDAIMLLLAAAAGWWAKPSHGVRNALIVLGAVGVFAGVSYGVVAARRAWVTAPETIQVAGKPFPLHQGRVFLFFFNPECPHCDHAARELAKLNWGGTKVIAVSTQMPEFAQEFVSSTGLPALLSSDAAVLSRTFSFVGVPYGVALENGHQRAVFTDFDAQPVAGSLRQMGFIR